MPRVQLLTKYSSAGPSSRHRTLKVLPQIAEVDLTVSPFFSDEYVRTLYDRRHQSRLEYLRAVRRRLRSLRSSHTFDAIVAEKELLPWLPLFVEDFLLPKQTPLVLDYDDAVYVRYRDKPLLSNKIPHLMRRASRVVCGNLTLQRYASDAGASTTLIPTTVDLQRYTRSRRAGSDKSLAIGWVGSPTTDRYLDMILDTMDSIHARHPFRLVLVGASERAELTSREYVEIVPWSQTIEENLSGIFDVGIMPLTDDEFSRAKCGFKILQYAACGLPVIASAVGANNEIVLDSVTGLLVSGQQDWSAALSHLLSHPELIEPMGDAAYSRVREKYSLPVAVRAWHELLYTVLSARPGSPESTSLRSS